MEPQVDRLVEKTWYRLLIAISGIPGSGKSTLAAVVTSRLNARWRASRDAAVPDIAAFIPMDGYHYTRAYLSTMPDPKLAVDRRGSHWTFDALAFLRLVQTLRPPLTPTTPTIFAPSFSHKTKDPVENDIPIPPCSRVLVFEGNYLSLDLAPWNEAAKLMDELWFMEVDPGVAKRRLVERHMRTGITLDRETAERRVDGNDLPNGEEIIKGRLEVQEVVKSMEDEEWAPGGDGA